MNSISTKSISILHFLKTYPETSITFIKGFIRSSAKSFDVRISGFNVQDDGIRTFKLPKRYYNRLNPVELVKYLYDKISRKKIWERSLDSYLSDPPDLIHIHFGDMGVLFIDYMLKFNRYFATVTTFYGFDASSLPKSNSHYQKRLKTLFQYGTAFMVEGPAMGEKLVSLGCSKQKILLNPLIVKTADIPQRRPYITLKTPKFLMVGRFVEKKGFHLALEALGQIKDELPEFTITIIGFGEMEQNYKQVIKKYCLEKRVFFKGKQTHDQVLSALATHDFFLHPSVTASNGDSEGGAPTIIIEAQAAKIPVISTDHADIPFIMGYHNFLAKEGDLESLKDAIKKAIRDEKREELLDKGYQHVLRQHDFDTSKVYEDNLRKVLSMSKDLQ